MRRRSTSGAVRFRSTNRRPRKLHLERLETRHLLSAVSERLIPLLHERSESDQQNFYVYQNADSPYNHSTASGLFVGPNENLIGRTPEELAEIFDQFAIDAGCVHDSASATGCSLDSSALDRTRGTVLRLEILPRIWTLPENDPVTFAGLAFETPEGFFNGVAGAGYDLTGATEVTFDVLSHLPPGDRTLANEQFEVRFGVSGRNAAVRLRRHSDNFTTVTIPLEAMGIEHPDFDLKKVNVLFSIGVDKANVPDGVTLLIDNIRFSPVPTRQAAVLGLPLGNEVFGVVPSGVAPIGPDQAIPNLATVYEASLTVMSLLHHGSPRDLRIARHIADTLVYALKNDVARPPTGIGIPTSRTGARGLHDGYSAGEIALFNNQQSGPKKGQIRFAGFSVPGALCSPDPDAERSFCLVQDGANGGNNAFGMFALLAAYQQFGSTAYLDAAREIGRWIVGVLRDGSLDGYGGYFFGFNEGGGTRTLQRGKSVENNADIFAALTWLANVERGLGNTASADAWMRHAHHAGRFVMRMFDNATGRFFVGTIYDDPNGRLPEGPGLDPRGPRKGRDIINIADFLDASTFTLFGLAKHPDYRNSIDWRRPVRYALEHFRKTATVTVKGASRTLEGFGLFATPVDRDGVAMPDGIAWEFTGQMVVAMKLVDELYRDAPDFEQYAFGALPDHFLAQIRNAQLWAPFGDGRGVVAATLEGENNDAPAFPPRDQCLNTPFQCIPERVGLAATTWAYFADQNYDPFEFPQPFTRVVQTEPALDSHEAPGDSPVEITFNQVMLGASLSSDSLVVHGMQTGKKVASQTAAEGNTISFLPATPFHAGELVEVSATSLLRSAAGSSAPFVLRFRAGVGGGTGYYAGSDSTLGRAVAHDLAIGDLNGDGQLDVLMATPTVTVPWLNQGNGQYRQNAGRLSVANAIALGDIDGDGDLDAMLANGNEVKIWRNDGTGIFADTRRNLSVSGVTDIEFGDLDGDGDLDLLATSSAEGGLAWLNDGLGVYTTTGQRLKTSGQAAHHGVVLGDVDHDGDLDAIVARGDTRPIEQANVVWLNDGRGMFLDIGQRFNNLDSRDIALGDLDGDGDLDAFVVNRLATGLGNRVLLNNGYGSFADTRQRFGIGIGSSVELGDVDGDGDLDALVESESGYADQLWVNDGKGNFRGSRTFDDTLHTLALALGDLDADGDLDAIMGGASGELNRVWLNQELPARVDAALGVTDARVRFNQQHFFVFHNADSAYNHGLPAGFIAGDSTGQRPDLVAKIAVNAACVSDLQTASGCSTNANVLDRERGTVLNVKFPALAGSEFAALTIQDPKIDPLRPSANGFDLRGATELWLEARSPSPGGIDVQFGVGGKNTNRNAPYHIGDTWTTIGPILLADLRNPDTNLVQPPDLSDVNLLFSVVVAAGYEPEGGTILLDNVRFDPVPDKQRRALGLPVSFETFGTLPSGRPPISPDQALPNLASTQDAALAILALLARGRSADRASARLIADTLVYAHQHDHSTPPQGIGLPVAPDGARGLHAAHFGGDIALLNDQVGGARAGQVRLAGFSVPSGMCSAIPGQQQSFCLVLDGGTGGSNAHAVLGLLSVYDATGNVTYLNTAREISRWISGVLQDDTNPANAARRGFGGYFAGFGDGGQRVLNKAKSTAQNAVISSAFAKLAAVESQLGNAADSAIWQSRSRHAGDFVMRMFDAKIGRFQAGTGFDPDGPGPIQPFFGPGSIPNGPRAGKDVTNTFDSLDQNSVATLALAGQEPYRNAIDWRRPVEYVLNRFRKSILVEIQGEVQPLDGFSLVRRPITDINGQRQPGADGIAWESTAQFVAMMRSVDSLYGESRYERMARFYVNQLRFAQGAAPFTDGRGLVGSTLDGESDSLSRFSPLDQCLSTPFQCIPERVGLGATSWAVFAEWNRNIFGE